MVLDTLREPAITLAFLYVLVDNTGVRDFIKECWRVFYVSNALVRSSELRSRTSNKRTKMRLSREERRHPKKQNMRSLGTERGDPSASELQEEK